MNRKYISRMFLTLLITIAFLITAFPSVLCDDPVVDVSQGDHSGGTEFNGLCDSDDILAQSFKTTVKTLAMATLWLNKYNVQNENNLKVTISSSKEGSALASCTLKCSYITSSSKGLPIPIVFEDITVTPGNTYWIRIQLDEDPRELGYVAWFTDDPDDCIDAYRDGESWGYSAGQGWFEREEKDQTFITYGYDKVEPSPEHYAVIICGGTDDDLQEYFNADANMAYTTFRTLGYPNDHINCLDQPSRSDVETALKVWLGERSTEQSKVFIYITDHGSKGGYIWINPSQTLSSSQLAGYLDEVEYKSMTIMIQCCYAGAFIDSLSGINRIILASTDASSNSHAYGAFGLGCSAFSGEMFKGLGKKGSYGDAFYFADGAASSLGDNPQINDPSGIADKTYPGYTAKHPKEKNDYNLNKIFTKPLFSKIVIRFQERFPMLFSFIQKIAINIFT